MKGTAHPYSDAWNLSTYFVGNYARLTCQPPLVATLSQCKCATLSAPLNCLPSYWIWILNLILTAAPSALSCGNDTVSHRIIKCVCVGGTSNSMNKRSHSAKIKPPKKHLFVRWQMDKLQEEALRCFQDVSGACHVTLPFQRSQTANCLCKNIKTVIARVTKQAATTLRSTRT